MYFVYIFKNSFNDYNETYCVAHCLNLSHLGKFLSASKKRPDMTSKVQHLFFYCYALTICRQEKEHYKNHKALSVIQINKKSASHSINTNNSKQ